ncbi:MAG: NAD-dependent deacylase [Ignavibacteriales bacterium]|nr:NAD-dependent deacylase [Ignavibacteriales bacterium]
MTISATLIARLSNAQSVCVLTGAGVSAESGVPTFRGADGLWSKFKPEELANFNAFIRNPALVWEWYSYRKKVIKEVQPNPAHYALVELEQRIPNFTLVTQNVDGLHRRAGSKHILELHGNIERSYCIDCSAFANDIVLDESKEPPHCKHCGGLLRPDVVWFGEMLPEGVFEQALGAARRCDVFLCLGTSAVVYPAASLPLEALEQGAYVVEINQEYTDLSSRVQEAMLGKVGIILPQLIQALQHQ